MKGKHCDEVHDHHRQHLAVVAVCCTMYRAAVVLFDFVIAFCVFKQKLEFVQSFRNISVYGRRFSQGSCSGEFWKNEN